MPKLLEIRDFASAGINSDILAWDLPPQFLTEMRNVRIFRNSLSPFGGVVVWKQLPVFNPGMIMHVGATSGTFWIIAGDTKVYAFDGETFYDITRVGFLNVPNQDLWTDSMLSRIPVINNPGDYPQYWSPQSGATPLTILPWDATNTWEDVGQSCGIMRSHKQFLFALKVQPTGGVGEQIVDGVRWSSPADINGVPESWDELDTTNVAGLTTLGGDGGEIIDGLSLRDAFVVYRERSISVFDYVGGVFVWQIRHMSTTVGLLASYCIAEVKGKHYFIGDGDILVNDGNSIQSLLHNRLRVHFVSHFNTEYYYNAFVVKQNVRSEIWFCIPSIGSVYPDLIYIYNWRDESWTIRDVDESIHGAYGSQRTASPSWETIGSTWDEITSVWNLGGLSPLQDTIVMISQSLDEFLCKTYECDAYDQALRSLNPAAYFPFTGGMSETNGNADNGGIVFDQVGTNDLTITGNYLNVNAPEILVGTCTGKSYFLGATDVSGELEADPHSMASQSGNGTIAGTFDFTTAVASSGLTVQWVRDGSSTNTTFISISNNAVGNLTSFGVGTRLLDSGGNQLNYVTHTEDIAGLPDKDNFQIVWTASGVNASAITTWTVYQNWDYSAPLFNYSQPGVINGPNTNPSRLNLIGRDNGSQFNLVIEREITESEMDTIAAALSQNDPNYIDPDPNCINPICKVYECDALRKAIIAAGANSYYPLTNGWSAVSSPDGGPVSTGDILFDVIGTKDMEAGHGDTSFDPLVAGIYDGCDDNTAIYSNGGATFRVNALDSYQYPSGGTMMYVEEDDVLGGTGGAIDVTWLNGPRVVLNGGINSGTFEIKTNLQVFNSALPARNPRSGIIIIRWIESGGTVAYKVVTDAGIEFEGTLNGTMTSTTMLYSELTWYKCKQSDAAFWDRPISDAEMDAIMDGWFQNKTGYIDPNPNCLPGGQ